MVDIPQFNSNWDRQMTEWLEDKSPGFILLKLPEICDSWGCKDKPGVIIQMFYDLPKMDYWMSMIHERVAEWSKSRPATQEDIETILNGARDQIDHIDGLFESEIPADYAGDDWLECLDDGQLDYVATCLRAGANMMKELANRSEARIQTRRASDES